MITQQQAEKLVYDAINQKDLSWQDKPEMVITKVEPHPLGWVIFYTSRPYHETGDFKFAIAGNAPYLVSHEDGTMIPTGTRPPVEDRIQEAAEKLTKQLQRAK